MSGPTSKIKVFTDVKFQPGSTLTRDTRNQFPTNPEVGMDTMVNGVYYYYGAPDGETPMWIPVGNKRSHSTVNVQTPQLDWTIEHKLGTHNVIAVAYDTNGKVMDASFTILSANVIKFTFAIPVAGKVTVFGTSEKFAGYTPYNDSLNQETVEIGITEPDNAIDTLIKNTNFGTENKLITFDPHKQKYKPTYTLIPLVSSGYYDINENDLINLSENEKKNINIPVLNETRAITDLRNFKITL